jgi:hypothetical protein
MRLQQQEALRERQRVFQQRQICHSDGNGLIPFSAVKQEQQAAQAQQLAQPQRLWRCLSPAYSSQAAQVEALAPLR